MRQFRTQDSKFNIVVDYEDDGMTARLHGQSGEVPHDEPLFIFRARDKYAVAALVAYRDLCEKGRAEAEHLKAIDQRIQEFQEFRDANPSRMKVPDTDLGQAEMNKIERHFP